MYVCASDSVTLTVCLHSPIGRLGTTQSECESHGCCWSPGAVSLMYMLYVAIVECSHNVLFWFAEWSVLFLPNSCVCCPVSEPDCSWLHGQSNAILLSHMINVSFSCSSRWQSWTRCPVLVMQLPLPSPPSQWSSLRRPTTDYTSKSMTQTTRDGRYQQGTALLT